MKKVSEETITRMRNYAILNPEINYRQIGSMFGISEISVKRHCSDLGRSKQWRKGRQSGNTDPDQFWSRVNLGAQTECWPWTASVNNSGYGFVYSQGKNKAAHRLAYELTHGQIPNGMELDHTCKNRRCCNPDHLMPVSHRENLKRAGRIPRHECPPIATTACLTGSPVGIDTPDSTLMPDVPAAVAHYVEDTRIRVPVIETDASHAAVSIPERLPQQSQASPARCEPSITTARPRRSDPFAPICVMQPPGEIDILHPLPRLEGPSGAKADIGVTDWAQTEYGSYWMGQTDEQLRQRTISQQTEEMREAGEFLHWYTVLPTDCGRSPQYMSARTGPEACVKVERYCGRGWAASWQYMRPDPHRGPFFHHRIILVNGDLLGVVARTINDAVAMVEEIWGPAVVLQCERLGRSKEHDIRWWSQRWRENLKEIRETLEQRRRAA